VAVGTIKKHWTGKGNATKEAMIAEATRRGFTVKNSDEADALALLDFALGRE
jgi:Holliday junction resolvasome RuvABC endonuclease subunit